MRLLYSVALAGVAHVAMTTYAANSTPEVMEFQVEESKLRNRVLQTNMLCGAGTSSAVQTIQPYCAAGSQTMDTTVWTPCCSFEGDSSNKMCRMFTTDGKYCDPATDPQGCNQLGEDDIMELDLTFDALPEEEKCCKQCLCYGDPECISFSGIQDVWIPCDGRDDSCRATKKTCESLAAPNGKGSCKWVRADRDDSRGWDFPMYGSPCLPDLSSPITMNMYNYQSGSSKFSVDLYLGERGIISQAEFTLDNKKYKLDAQTCFDEAGADSWEGGSAPAGAITDRTRPSTQIAWSFFHPSTKTFVKLFCVRAVSEEMNGIPRINIQEVTVEADQAGNGFCATGEIGGRSGEFTRSKELHRKCVQSQADAIQACKHLVNFAYTYRELEQCATQFCQLADVPTEECIKYMGGGTDPIKWKRKYCEALKNAGQIPKSTKLKNCMRELDEEGYDFATKTWGNGVATQVKDKTCKSSISMYDVSKKNMCEDGLSIEILNDEGVWEEVYWIPATNGPCGGKLIISAAEAKVLFTHSIRIKQCDARSEPACESVSTCTETVGATFQLKYTNPLSQLWDLYSTGVLRCPDNGSGDLTWCLPKSGSYVSQDLCPCPEDSRRVLLGL